MIPNYDTVIKYIIVGDSTVGKSSILLRFTEDRFIPVHDLTVGIEFATKIIDADADGHKVRL